MMDAMDAIFTRRSVRDFTSQPIPDELLDKVLQAGVAAPSGGNLQACRFVLVQSPERLAGLRALAPGIIGRPTAMIAICKDNRPPSNMGGVGDEHSAWIDVGTALENMLLGAHSQGLGACPIGSFHKQAVAEFLDLPEHVSVVLLLALGTPRTSPGAPGRRPLSEVVFRERWGGSGSG